MKAAYYLMCIALGLTLVVMAPMFQEWQAWLLFVLYAVGCILIYRSLNM